MARIVMKFGGTSMAGTERIRRVANIVRKQQAAGHEVAVVVSAMAGETDRLVNFCREANPLYDPAEYDVVVASGEQVTSGLLALTTTATSCPAACCLRTMLATRRMRSVPAIEVPPNFITMRAKGPLLLLVSSSARC